MKAKEKDKDFVCRHCARFLNSVDLDKGKCPDCKSDEGIFLNDLKK